jgi:hypothetical protein
MGHDPEMIDYLGRKIEEMVGLAINFHIKMNMIKIIEEYKKCV